MQIDYVCGADVDESDSRHFTEYNGDTFHFCSPECKRRFDDHPDHYIREQARRTLGI